MKESALRDLIAQKISQLKPGLTLLQKEQYIPGEPGTKSFIDLYARDENGRHVLIELKRSNTAARQALHEVSKYVEQVKQHFGAKDSEIFAIIASTEWGELLLPFSRFCEDAGFSIEIILTVRPALYRLLQPSGGGSSHHGITSIGTRTKMPCKEGLLPLKGRTARRELTTM